MAESPARDHYKHQLPPSPPPSPPAARRRPKKKHDPFEELARTPVPSRPTTPEDVSADEEYLLTKIILTPILFISFLVSLCLVNHQNRARRKRAHSSSSSILAYFSPSTWLDPEPYQDPDELTWDRKGATSHVKPDNATGPATMNAENKKKKSWHLNKKIRKVTKMEVSDAFEMRGRIIVGMMVVMCFSCVGIWCGMKWLLTLVTTMITGSRS